MILFFNCEDQFLEGEKIEEKENYEIFNFKLKRASISQFL